MNVITLFFIILIFSINATVSAFVNPPQINFNATEHTLEAGDNFTIICKGNTLLKWDFPSIKDTDTNISIFNYVEDFDGFIVSKLQIINITYQYVGFYVCYEENNSTRNSSIYLYVHDDHHLSVDKDVDEDFNRHVFGTEGNEILIPCRFTSPDIELNLRKNNGNFQLDPKYGFRSQKNASIEDGSIYKCQFRRDNVTRNYRYYIHIEPPIDFLAQPAIEEVEHGGYGGNIILKCQILTELETVFDWKYPPGDHGARFFQRQTDTEDDDMKISTLKIFNATLEDRGEYWCNVKDHQNHHSSMNHYLKIYGPGDHFINFTSKNYSKSYDVGSNVHWEVEIDAFPVETYFFWTNNKHENLSAETSSLKYLHNITKNSAELVIKDINYADHGIYTLFGRNKFDNEKFDLKLDVRGKPQIDLQLSKEYQVINQKTFVNCIVTANPKPLIRLEFKACEDNCEFKNISSEVLHTHPNKYSMNLTENLDSSGIIRCVAVNSYGYVELQKNIYVSDIEEGFAILGLNEEVIHDKNRNEVIAAEKSSITATCGAYKRNEKQKIDWFKGSKKIRKNKKYLLEEQETEFSDRIKLTIFDINFNDSAVYSCLYTLANFTDEKYFSLIVSYHSVPKLISKSNGTVEINFGESTELKCVFTGLPKPIISWYKDNERLTDFKLGTDPFNVNLTKTSIKPKKEGIYKCGGSNKYGMVSEEISVVFKAKSNNRIHTIVIIFFGVVIIAAFIMIYIKDSRKKKLEKVLREAGLKYFETGQVENLNPELGIEDQAELLPFDKRWEFPINNLKLGKQLGAGAFGVVVKGQAKGILPDEEVTTVAVKMVKRTADHIFVKALASELKIMSHLGNHLNVVNLLGACTKNVARRELFVIVEYCKFGNLHNYLFRHRKEFINQIDPESSTIDFYLGKEKLERSYSVASDRSYLPMKYAAQFSVRSNSIKSFEGYRQDQGNKSGLSDNSAQINLCPRTEQEGEMLLSNSSAVELEWRTYYKGDYKGTVKPISTKDLLIWSFQVARGMEYLASRKVLHGDLAARNILLADDNVVKICDFGLAKNLYKDDNYKKKSNSPLPIKWMAIESIRDRVFSTQSDVWSFGIVLWELFSLARTPYPGMEADEKLYAKLVEGYRMEAPKYSNNDIYQLMLDCWSKKPLNRPSFTQLAEKLGNLLDENTTKHYIDLNDPYLSINIERFQQTDYLAMLNTPNFENLSSPTFYENDPQANYTKMSSPKIDVVNVFTFEEANKRKNSAGENVENIVLKVTNDGTAQCSFSNPSYSVPPINWPSEDTSKDPDINGDGGKEKGRESDGVHYVNSCSMDWEKMTSQIS